MSNQEEANNLEMMASCFYRLLHNKPWVFANERDKQNYMVVSREAVERVRVEQQQQPVGQKDVA